MKCVNVLPTRVATEASDFGGDAYARMMLDVDRSRPAKDCGIESKTPSSSTTMRRFVEEMDLHLTLAIERDWYANVQLEAAFCVGKSFKTPI